MGKYNNKIIFGSLNASYAYNEHILVCRAGKAKNKIQEDGSIRRHFKLDLEEVKKKGNEKGSRESNNK